MASLSLAVLLIAVDLAWLYVYFLLRRDFTPFILSPSSLCSGLDNSTSPLVSVIIPARNEQENIAACLDGYLGQTYRNIEIIVVDDNSEDATKSIAQELAATRGGGRVKILTKGDPPPGWLGKQHAAQAGLEVAGGEWLLFADADTSAHPDAVGFAIGLAGMRRLDLLSFSPEQVCATLWEKIAQPVFYRFLNLRYRYARVNDPSLPDAAAHGAFLLIRKDTLSKLGGFGSVRGSLIDDADLAALAKSKGCKLHFAPVRGLVKIRMYRSLAELVGGWSKNSLAFLQYKWANLLKYGLFLAWLSMGPFAMAPIALASGRPFAQIAAAVSLTFILLVESSLRAAEGFSRSWSLSLPLGGAVVLAIFAKSALHRAAGSKVAWKGRFY